MTRGGKAKMLKVQEQPVEEAKELPKSPYFLYLREQYDSVQASNPALTPKDITLRIGVMWKDLPKEEKEAYEVLFEESKKEKTEKPTGESEDLPDPAAKEVKLKRSLVMAAKPKQSPAKEAKPKQSPAKDQTNNDKPPPPKKPSTTYILFTLQQRKKINEENPSLSQPEIMKEMGARWKAASDEEKKPFKDQYEEAKKAFDQEKREYEAKYGKIVRASKKTAKKQPFPDEAVGGDFVEPLGHKKRVRIRQLTPVTEKKRKLSVLK